MKQRNNIANIYFQLFPIPTQRVYYTIRVVSSFFFESANYYKMCAVEMIG